MATQQPPATTSAAHFAALHAPGNPLVVPNIWDLASLKSVLSLNSSSSSSSSTSPLPVKAIATASYAIAESLGLADADLSAGANLIRISQLAPRVRAAGLPLTVDIQDGYGARLDDVVAGVVRAGAAGANVEDLRDDGKLWDCGEQVERLKRVIRVAAENGCHGFVVNARCDVLCPWSPRDGRPGEEDRLLAEAVRRGKAYLEAGATTVFVWGGPRGLRDEEIRTLVREFGGRLAVKLAVGEKGLTVRELADMGVARISVGPMLFLAAGRTVREGAERIVGGGRL
ncbi:phosphoenolpyruvate phosphomutase-domain-containing protein [Xylaria cf. heliscus]|nr:phosphoenolpyruvate phosphomutase-domain-containing protein [Xylaria cf. heliscus]